MARVIADCANCGNTSVNELCEDCRVPADKAKIAAAAKEIDELTWVWHNPITLKEYKARPLGPKERQLAIAKIITIHPTDCNSSQTGE